jgi:hypothetical protein
VPATTRSGFLAKLAYIQELSAHHETNWMVEAPADETRISGHASGFGEAAR